MFDVVCVGILVADIITKAVDKIPDKGKLGLVDVLQMHLGGCAGNAAVSLAKLGAKTALIGMVGSDSFGSFLRSELSKHNVNVQGVAEAASMGTSASVVLSDSTGERTFLHCLGSNSVFRERDIDYSVVVRSRFVFVAGSMLMPSFDGGDCALFLRKAKQMGKTTVLDTAWDDTGRWMQVLEPCMRHLDYFIPSIEEAQQLSGKKQPEDIAELFFAKGVKSVVIKLGKNGCYIQEHAGVTGRFIPTYKTYEAVDTTGAGDSFCAGFLYGLSRGLSMEDSCQLANAVGTHCVMHTGATTGIRSYTETVHFMEENPL